VRHFAHGEGGQSLGSRMALIVDGLRKRGANVAAQRIVAGQSLVGALQDDDVLLALERGDDGGLGEGRMTLTWMEPTATPRVWRR